MNSSPFSCSNHHPLITVVVLLFFTGPALARIRHVITVSSGLDPGSLAWDPTAQHFLVGSLRLPDVFSVSDAGVVETLIPSAASASNSFIAALAVDDQHRRLIVALALPPAIAAFDLRSPRPHQRLFLSPLPSDPAAIAVDPATGIAFVSVSNQIFRSDLAGNVSLFCDSKSFAGGERLDGLAHVSKGYLLAAQGSTGRVFKVDAEDAAAREVLSRRKLAAEAAAVAVRSDGTAVVAGGAKAIVVKSEDGFGEAGVFDEFEVGEGKRVKGVAVRDGRRAYLLLSAAEIGGRWGIEEVEWGREEREGEMVWGFVLLGLGLAYFMFWRFQMGRLVTSINKKRA